MQIILYFLKKGAYKKSDAPPHTWRIFEHVKEALFMRISPKEPSGHKTNLLAVDTLLTPTNYPFWKPEL